MARFIKPEKSLLLNTKIGDIEFLDTEYRYIEEEPVKDKIMILKKGIQKIEDLFEVKVETPSISQVWNSPTNFNIIATVIVKSEYGSTFGIASGNPLNLNSSIAKAYAVETSINRAKATALIELLRKNCIKEDLPLLYSSFDEFNTENSINNLTNITTNNTKGTTKEIKDNSKNKKSEETYKESNDNSLLYTRKYMEGITLSELLEKDKEYLKMLATKANKYRNLTNEFLDKNNISIESL